MKSLVLACVAALAVVLVAVGCSVLRSDDGSSGPVGSRGTTGAGDVTPSEAGQQAVAVDQAARLQDVPLRRGERFDTMAMPRPYMPSAPNGTGTDDYRCFVLDPHLRHDAFVTGLDVVPGTPSMVHHVILFQVPPSAVAAARRADTAERGEGWTCFGGTGLEQAGGSASTGGSLDQAPWLGAWAPGGGERTMARDVGIPLEAGSRIVMQVHYNLLAGARPDVTSAKLRLRDGSADLDALQTVLLPAPVELPCRAGHTDSPLCRRDRAVTDVVDRFGQVGMLANYIHFLCGNAPPGPVQSCERVVEHPETVRAVAGHMHLLGRQISIEVNPGKPDARTLLDIESWDFDDQGSIPVEPVRLRPGDTLRVTCRHDQSLRDLLPAFEGQPDRYVVWGEGTTDEMCLGILLVTRP